MKRYIILLLSIMTIGLPTLVAQTISGDVVSSKINETAIILNDYQNMLASKDKSPEIKRYYMNQALSLFVNNGNPFRIDTVHFQGATISMKSSLRNKPVRRKVSDYFQGVMDLRYSPVDLTAMKIPAIPSQINISDLVRFSDNLYKYTFLVTRELAGYIDGTPVYRDITPYEYSIFLLINKTIDGTEYNVLLNDIEIEEKENQGTDL